MWLRVALSSALLGLGITLTIAWGWRAAVAYGFLLAVALLYVALFALWTPLIQDVGRRYFERRLGGPRPD